MPGAAAFFERGATRRNAFGQLLRAFPARTGAMLLLCATSGLVPAVFALLVGRLVEAVSDVRRLTVTLVLIGGILIIDQLVTYAREVLTADLYRRFDEHLLGRVVAAATDLPGLDLFDDPDAAAQRDRAARAVRFAPGDLVSGINANWTKRATGFAAALLLIWHQPVVGAAVTLLWILIGRQVQANAYRMNPFWTEPLRRAEYFKRIGLRPEWAKEQRIFGLGAWVVDRFGGEWSKVMAELCRVRKVGTARLALLVAAVAVANGVALEFLVARRPGAGELAVVLQALLGAAALAAQDGDVYIEDGARQVPDVQRVERMVADRTSREQRSPRDSGLTALDLVDKPEGAAPVREIRFERVSFAYPGREAHPVYQDLDLTIEGGASLAVVGVNGAGKTTLVKLLTGLARPTSGRITVDGADLADLPPEEWRHQIAAVFQDFVHYPLSARDNLAFGAPDASVTDDELWTAAERAGARQLLERLPDGLETVLSRRYVGGVDLSGGQWQRIALARALLAVLHGARVLLLDEPTAQLDVRAEADLYDRFLELTRGLTSVLISHRFSTVRRAGRILVLDGGRIAEDGTHESLLAAGGLYADMFRAQAARFLSQQHQDASR